MSEIVLEGYLLPARGGNVRLVTASACLEFSRSEVIDVENRPLATGITPGIGAPVCVTLRAHAALLDAYPAAHFEEALRVGRRPFAFAARHRSAEVPDAPRYRALEREYLQQHGLLEQCSADETWAAR